MNDDFRNRLERWGARYEYRLGDILSRFDRYDAERRERELAARRAAILKPEGNEDVQDA